MAQDSSESMPLVKYPTIQLMALDTEATGTKSSLSISTSEGKKIGDKLSRLNPNHSF